MLERDDSFCFSSSLIALLTEDEADQRTGVSEKHVTSELNMAPGARDRSRMER